MRERAAGEDGEWGARGSKWAAVWKIRAMEWASPLSWRQVTMGPRRGEGVDGGEAEGGVRRMTLFPASLPPGQWAWGVSAHRRLVLLFKCHAVVGFLLGLDVEAGT